MDDWRGDAAAAFLIQLQRVGSQAPVPCPAPPFSIAAYVRNLFSALGRRQPQVADRFRPFVFHLEERLFPVLDRLPPAFCHGDVHPLNIIWGKRSIRAVIDWEFCGVKPEIYDPANLLGCLGMEDPRSLTGPFVRRLIGRLRQSAAYGEASWAALPELILAVRFGWLSEWLRTQDRSMIRMEADYMTLLVECRPTLTSIVAGQGA